jgi:hypothetical protein
VFVPAPQAVNKRANETTSKKTRDKSFTFIILTPPYTFDLHKNGLNLNLYCIFKEADFNLQRVWDCPPFVYFA